MKNKKVISWKNKAMGSPLQLFIIIWLLLDRYNASQLVYGIIGTLCMLVLIAYIADRLNTTEIDIFEENAPIKKSLKDRIQEVMNKKPKSNE
jgi:hypothetical protein